MKFDTMEAATEAIEKLLVYYNQPAYYGMKPEGVKRVQLVYQEEVIV